MTNEIRHPKGTPVGGQFAEGRRHAPAASARLTAPAPAMPTPADDRLLGDLRGAFAGGYDSGDTEAILGSFEGAEMACVWDQFDEAGDGYVGASRIVGRVGDGPWRPIHPDLWDHLSDPRSDALTPRTPLLADDPYPVQDLTDRVWSAGNFALARTGVEPATSLPDLAPGEATYERFLTAGSHQERWHVAYAAAVTAWHDGDEAIETNLSREDAGDALHQLDEAQQGEVFRRVARYADVDPTVFGAAVFDEAHAIVDEQTEAYWAGLYAASGASRQPTYSAEEIRSVYSDNPAKRHALLNN